MKKSGVAPAFLLGNRTSKVRFTQAEGLLLQAIGLVLPSRAKGTAKG